MKNLYGVLAGSILLFVDCSDVSREKRPLVNEINEKVRHIDANHRVQIIEDDFHQGDSVYKIRGYLMEGIMLKLVGVLNTPHVERDDYFYFENGAPIFSGHVVVSRDDHVASEFKYYYDSDGTVDEALFWKDVYERGKQFPHEHFQEFNPDQDSLKRSEDDRLAFFIEKLSMEGFEIRHLNENRDANVAR
ncbi:MAG: hypothetical protein ABJN36_01745 [Cyclobacteriaceae bacterium]